MNIHAAVVWDV